MFHSEEKKRAPQQEPHAGATPDSNRRRHQQASAKRVQSAQLRESESRATERAGGLKGELNHSDFLILLVEDDEGDSILLQRALKRHGVMSAVQWVKDGLEALHYLQGDGPYANRTRYPFPELIILDLKMPRMSGLELLSWIRDHPDLRAIPTLVMSSSQSVTDMETAYALGANIYTVKPADFGSLVKFVKDACASWASETVAPIT